MGNADTAIGRVNRDKETTMNIKDFSTLATKQHPNQCPEEWECFLEFVEAHFKNRGIEHPIVVELGIEVNHQKRFYEELLGTEHIGIDILQRGEPDILGNTHDEETLNKLKAKLNGRDINLLFIDASHRYEDAKKDYEMYGPLTRNIIAFHDVLHNDPRDKGARVRLLWEEIMRDENKYMKVVFSLRHSYMGIGVIIKE